jgi:hypothetical protein
MRVLIILTNLRGRYLSRISNDIQDFCTLGLTGNAEASIWHRPQLNVGLDQDHRAFATLPKHNLQIHRKNVHYRPLHKLA